MNCYKVINSYEMFTEYSMSIFWTNSAGRLIRCIYGLKIKWRMIFLHLKPEKWYNWKCPIKWNEVLFHQTQWQSALNCSVYSLLCPTSTPHCISHFHSQIEIANYFTNFCQETATKFGRHNKWYLLTSQDSNDSRMRRRRWRESEGEEK